MRLLILLSASFLTACDPSTGTGSSSGETVASVDGVVADKLFTGGTIYTGLQDLPRAQVVAVSGDRIIFAGDEAEAAPFIGPETETVDLGGAFMFPGFTDSHVHLDAIGEREWRLNLETAQSLAEMLEMVAEAAEDEDARFIYGQNWIETHWPEFRFPTRAELDAIDSERPIIVMRADRHAMVVNTAALEYMGVGPDTPDPEGGSIERDENGEPTGVLIDTATYPLQELAGNLTAEEFRMSYRLGAEAMASYGWTGVHFMRANPYGVDLSAELAEDGEMPIRVYNVFGAEHYAAAAEAAPQFDADALVTSRGVKVYVDGALGSRGALMFEPYNDDPDSTGLILMNEDVMVPMMEQSLRDGVQMSIHAIGDAGNRLALDWVEAAYEAVPVEDRAVADPRWRIEHAQVVHPDDFDRFAELDLIASMQPSHAIGDLHFADDRIGVDRMAGAYAWSSMLDAGVIVTGGSDAPVERGEARIEYYAAAVRKDLEGRSDEGWHLEEAVDRLTALKMFTIWPAYASFREDELGTIEVGKLADFSVFDRDLMVVPDEELKDAVPVMTVVGGEVVFEADAG